MRWRLNSNKQMWVRSKLHCESLFNQYSVSTSKNVALVIESTSFNYQWNQMTKCMNIIYVIIQSFSFDRFLVHLISCLIFLSFVFILFWTEILAALLFQRALLVLISVLMQTLLLQEALTRLLESGTPIFSLNQQVCTSS